MKRNLSIFTVILFLFVFSSKTVFASQFPPVTSGAGFFLPDSPFYTLDKLYQKVKLAIALTPEKRAEVRNQILGERMAELRVMYAKADRRGINLALIELTEEARKAEADIKEAQALGKNVSVLAKNVSDNLREYRMILSSVSEGATSDVSLSLESANESLLASKITVEDFLNASDLEEAVNNDLEDELNTNVLGVSTRADKIEAKIERLQKKASEAAELERRKILAEQAKLKKLEQNKRQKRIELLERRKKLIEERKKKLEAAREAAKKAREAAEKFRESKRNELELRKNTEAVESNEVETNTESSNSGSGSSNSGPGSIN